MLDAAPAKEESPEEEFCATDAGVRPAGPTRLDGSPDDELPLQALSPRSRDESGADGVAVFLGRPAARLFLRGLPPERLPPDITLFHCAVVLLLLLLPAVVAAIAVAGRCFYCWRSLVLTMVLCAGAGSVCVCAIPYLMVAFSLFLPSHCAAVRLC